MAERIVVALDHSKYAAAAMAIAQQLAHALPDSVLVGLHVVNVRKRSGNLLRDLGGLFGFEPAVVSDAEAERRLEEARAFLDSWAEGVRSRGSSAETRLETGKVVTSIESCAEAADLLVLGLRGETEERFPGQGGDLAGMLAERVGVPILFAAADSHPLRAVAIGYDGSEGAKHAVSAARRFIVPLGVPIHLVHIGDEETGRPLLDEAEAQLGEAETHRHVIERHPQARRRLVGKAQELGVQLLLLGFQGRSALKDFVVGSWTERIVTGGDLSVLVAH